MHVTSGKYSSTAQLLLFDADAPLRTRYVCACTFIRVNVIPDMLGRRRLNGNYFRDQQRQHVPYFDFRPPLCSSSFLSCLFHLELLDIYTRRGRSLRASIPNHSKHTCRGRCLLLTRVYIDVDPPYSSTTKRRIASRVLPCPAQPVFPASPHPTGTETPTPVSPAPQVHPHAPSYHPLQPPPLWLRGVSEQGPAVGYQRRQVVRVR